jgi:protein tyrosine phosphatase (PTP) superfamily phosphohydrolase (DUF442 family)
MPLTLAPPAPHAPVSDLGPSPTGRRTGRSWRRRAFRLALGVAAVLAVGNICILAAHAVAQTAAGGSPIDVPDDVAAIRNFEAVDAKLWRGGAPSTEDYRALAAAGVTTIVDLRAEKGLHDPSALLDELGVARVRIPMRDGQTPTHEQVQEFMALVEASEGAVYLHCGAGVGRTGTMAAVYSVSHGSGGWSAMRENLVVGPPSLEQLAYAASRDAGEAPHRPNGAIVALSRTFDAPRRLWHVVRSL